MCIDSISDEDPSFLDMSYVVKSVVCHCFARKLPLSFDGSPKVISIPKTSNTKKDTESFIRNNDSKLEWLLGSNARLGFFLIKLLLKPLPSKVFPNYARGGLPKFSVSKLARMLKVIGSGLRNKMNLMIPG